MIIQTITWEDPKIDIDVLEEILSYSNIKNPDILMLASSCDTILTLMTDERIGSITCISPMSRNLAVLELKMYLLNEIEGYQERINFLEGMLTTEDSIEIYYRFREKLSSKKFWDDYIDILTHGIHLYDKWIKLFYKLKKNEYDFKKTFSYKKMTEILGQDMINNCIINPYWTYFENIFEKHRFEQNKIKNQTKTKNQNENGNNNMTNPYYYLMMNFQYQVDNIPKYLMNKLSDESIKKVKLINQDLVRYLYKGTHRFSIISLGTFVIDRFNNDELYTLFEITKRRLTYNGRLIIRKFNNDSMIRDIVSKFFIILDIDRNLIDRTHIYQQVIIAKPRH